ncbi:Sodium:solute symporter family protein [Lachnospiraceae bacterium NK3A20]|nr:Sodium:solute symporter family protein [Lachnospiraceae bacterium NK3A20]
MQGRQECSHGWLRFFGTIQAGGIDAVVSNADALPVDMLEGSASETIIIEISRLLSTYGILPALAAGIVLSGIMASTMSTADSQLLAASSSISNDILVKFLRLKVSMKTSLLIALAVNVIVSLTTKAPEKKLTDTFDKVSAIH